MDSNQVRALFLKYFEDEQHRIVSSASLIPADDPTLLFTNAGMNQFKACFLGHEDPGYKRATSSQKCVRAGGKHNDLDNVGYTARHHTFFEMLGNFSFGDYFKQRAIELAWRFLTDQLAIPTDKLYVTVFETDDEAYSIWRDHIGVPEDRIFRFGEKDNFWAMGDTGPCGPCSEIFYDYGDQVEGPADPYEAIASGSDKVVEMWNLVFMQYNRDEKGTLTPLPNPSIDTGMGLERILTVLQGVHNNYETDLFLDIMRPMAETLGISIGQSAKTDTALRVMADHLRAMTFLIADGVVPSNEGRGYVLRRIMRRAMRFGKQLGQDEPFLHQMVPFVVDKMGDAYPNLKKEMAGVQLLVKVEEQQFATTLNKGLPILVKYFDEFVAKGTTTVPGQVIHYLYGTHGFPVDLMEDMARDWQLTMDMKGFREVMDQEAANNRGAGEFVVKKVHPQLEEDSQTQTTEHLCYGNLQTSGTITRILSEDAVVETLEQGQPGELVLSTTSFYAESGGQIGDRGTITTESGVFEVFETNKVLDKLVVHKGKVAKGSISTDQSATAKVDATTRSAVTKNHTATHLLHEALRQVLGLHVRQAGSLVDADKLRFDFSHFEPLTNDQIKTIEAMVNTQILANTSVAKVEMHRDEAANSGAIAFFGEKYGERVRVVSVGEFSKEFCGGNHVMATGEIGPFKIISERGLAAGIRRLVAITGTTALSRFQESEQLLKHAQEKFFLNRDTFFEQLDRLHQDKKALEQKIEALKIQLAKGGSSQEELVDLGPYRAMLKQVSEVGGGQLRQLADELLNKVKTGVVLLGSEVDGKAQLLVKTNTDQVHAGQLVKQMAELVGGRGGGRPEMAMAGGKDASKLGDALRKGLEILQNQVN